FCDYFDLGRWIPAGFGCEVVSLYADLLDGVRWRVICAGIPRWIVQVPAVEREQVHVRAPSVYIHFGSAARIVHLLGSIDVEYAGKDASQADDVAAVQRQIDNAAVIHETGERCRIGVD